MNKSNTSKKRLDLIHGRPLRVHQFSSEATNRDTRLTEQVAITEQAAINRTKIEVLSEG